MQQALVTVVVPIYNVERYLDRCIESLVGQTYRNLEILLIDDGATDRCPEICDRWAQTDTRVRVVHQSNAGLGMTRNAGIRLARGEYLCLLDGDDYFTSDAVEKLVRKIQSEHAEMVCFGFSSVDANGRNLDAFIPGMEKTYRAEAVQKEFLPEYVAPDPRKKGPRLLYMSACMAMYDMELIRRSGWQFVSERQIISEDVYALLDLMRYVQSVTVLPEALYCYRQNTDSLSRSYRPGRYEKIKHFYLETQRLCQEIGYDREVVFRLSEPFISFALGAMKQEAAAALPRTVRMENLRRIIDDPLLQRILLQSAGNAMSVTRRIMCFCLRHKFYWICYCLLKAKA